MELFPGTPAEWRDEALAAHMETLRAFRNAANEAIEPLRKGDVIRSSLEARISAPADDDLVKALAAMGISRKEDYADPADPNDTLADMLIISDVELSGAVDGIAVSALTDDADWRKCERSWKFFKGTGDAEITLRDAAAVAELG